LEESLAEDVLYVVIDGVLLPAEAGTISVQDQGFLRGDGAFEVLLVYGGRPFAAGEHLDRLERSCAALRLVCPRSLIERDLLSLVEASGKATYAARIVLTRTGHRIALAEAWAPPTKPSRLWLVANHQQPLLIGIKSLSYAGNMLSKRLAREEGYDDALWMSEDGYVLEAQTAAFFWVSSAEELCTPPLSEPILDSITRRRIISQLEVRERRCPRAEALNCREAFLAGTTKEIQPVAAIEGRRLSEVSAAATKRAMEAYRRLIVAETGMGATELAIQG
jgi:branched-chain amino acid aminotransferase